MDIDTAEARRRQQLWGQDAPVRNDDRDICLKKFMLGEWRAAAAWERRQRENEAVVLEVEQEREKSLKNTVFDSWKFEAME